MLVNLFGLMLTQTLVVCMCASDVMYVLPDYPSNTSCPSQPCATLSQYLLDYNGMLPIVSNVECRLLPGEHHVPPNIRLYNLYNFTFAGITNKYLPPVVLINCLQSFIHITASKHVRI